MADAGSAGVSPIARHTSTPQELKDRLAAERTGMPHLIYRDLDGAQLIWPLPLSDSVLTVGRDGDCDISIHWDSEVSGVHAVMQMLGRRWTVTDEGLSLNGSFVNAQRVHGRHRLRDGDELRVGHTTIVFRSPDHTAAGTTPGIKGAVVDGLGEMDRRALVALCRPLLLDGDLLPATNKAIAEELHLSIPAVKKRLASLFVRFELTHLDQSAKRTRLAVEALQQGIVSSRDL